jgi:hypothetical protein
VSSVVVGEVVMLEPAAAAAAALVIFLADMDPANVQTLIISASVLAATSASLYFGLKVKWKRFSLVFFVLGQFPFLFPILANQFLIFEKRKKNSHILRSHESRRQHE